MVYQTKKFYHSISPESSPRLEQIAELRPRGIGEHVDLLLVVYDRTEK
jgi:hypothetical protein